MKRVSEGEEKRERKRKRNNGGKKKGYVFHYVSVTVQNRDE